MVGVSVWLLFVLTGNTLGFVFPSVRSETKRQLTSWEDEELLIQLLSIKKADVEMIVQAGRKFLQKVRQWQGAHPAESRLARCVIRHCIDSKIPGIVATAYDEEVDDDGRRGLSAPVWIEKPEDTPNFYERNSVTPIWDDSEEKHTFGSVDDIKLNKFLWKRKHKLLDCTFHYALSKFWEWVDSAP